MGGARFAEEPPDRAAGRGGLPSGCKRREGPSVMPDRRRSWTHLIDHPRVRAGVGVAMTGPVRGAAVVGAGRAGAVVAGACTGVGGGAAFVGAGFSAWVSTARVGARVAVGGGSVGVAG